MGSLILCHAKKARQPYEISRVQKKVYTIEELCYYIYHHLYLVDYTFANHQLCDWLCDELELEDLSDDLKRILNEDGKTEDFINRILRSSLMYADSDIDDAMENLRRFSEQKAVEKEKYKADQLMNNGDLESAVFVYLRMINQDWDETMDLSFYGRVYACLGSAYGRMFLYEESAKMYEQACKYLSDESVLKAYLYACMKAYTDEIFQTILNEKPDLSATYDEIKKLVEERQRNFSVKESDILLREWKNNNRGFHKI